MNASLQCFSPTHECCAFKWHLKSSGGPVDWRVLGLLANAFQMASSKSLGKVCFCLKTQGQKILCLNGYVSSKLIYPPR